MTTNKQTSCAISVRLTPDEKAQLTVMAQIESRSVDKQARLLILQAMAAKNAPAMSPPIAAKPTV